MRQWIVGILVALGAGAGVGNLGNLEDGATPVVAQVMALVAFALLALLKAAPDVNQNKVPDALEGTWAEPLVKWLLPILMGLAAAGGVVLTGGCSGGFAVTPGLPGYEVVESESDDDFTPDSVSTAWSLQTSANLGVRIGQTTMFGERVTTVGCLELVDSQDRWIRGWCYECRWVEGFGGCRLVDQASPAERIEP
jgi:hypothetical protein